MSVRRCLSALLVVLVGWVPAAATAQSAQQLTERFSSVNPAILKRMGLIPKACSPGGVPVRESSGNAWQVHEGVVAFWNLLAAIEKEDEEQHRLKGKGDLGFVSNAIPQGDANSTTRTQLDDGTQTDVVKVRASDVYTVNMGLQMRRGFYPGEFAFDARIDLRLQDGSFKEDVTNLGLSYDYYLRPWLEAYVFANRSTSSFMNIDQRYEVGGGLVLEARLGGHVDDPRSDIAKLRQLDQSVFGHAVSSHSRWHASPRWVDWQNKTAEPQWYQCLKAMDAAAASKVDLAELGRTLHVMWDDADQALHKRHSRVRLAVLFGALSEFEKATLSRTTTVTHSSTPMTQTITTESQPLLATQTTRASIRPTFEWRPTSHWRLYGRSYFKPSFDKTRVLTGNKDAAGNLETREVFDYRLDTEAGLVFSVADTELGQPGGVSVTATWENFRDSAPPTYFKYGADGQVEAGFAAPSSHNIFRIVFGITWR